MTDKHTEGAPMGSAWADLLSGEIEPRADIGSPGALGSLPTLDQRVELFLAAIHGPGRDFSSAERKAARARLLDEMANDLLQHPESALHTADQETATNGLAQGRSAAGQALPGGSLVRRLTGAVGEVARSLVHDLLYPLKNGVWLTSPRLRYSAVPLAFSLLLVMGWSGAWFYAARNAEARFAAISDSGQPWASHQCASLSKGGFPFRVELRCEAPTAVVAAQDNTLVFKAAEIVTTASLFGAQDLRGEIVGPIAISERGQTLAVANGDLGFDQTGQLEGNLKFTTTPAGLQHIVASLGGRDKGTLEQLDRLAQASLRPASSDTDVASTGDDEPDFGGQPVLDAPLNLTNGKISIGSVTVGRLAPLFKDAGSRSRSPRNP